MKKPVYVSFSMAAAVALTLTACGGGESDEADTPETTEAPAAAPATPAATEAAPAYASLTGNEANGEKVFIQCKTCHVVEAGQNRVGPSLHAIIGRTAGQVPGFNYSAANKSSGIVWTEEELYKYLENPQKVVPGTKMAFAGLKNPQDRADVIAYLKTHTN